MKSKNFCLLVIFDLKCLYSNPELFSKALFTQATNVIPIELFSPILYAPCHLSSLVHGTVQICFQSQVFSYQIMVREG